MLDILSKVDTEHKVIYVWFDTGIEYQATKNHLNYLEEKYGKARALRLLCSTPRAILEGNKGD